MTSLRMNFSLVKLEALFIWFAIQDFGYCSVRRFSFMYIQGWKNSNISVGISSILTDNFCYRFLPTQIEFIDIFGCMFCTFYVNPSKNPCLYCIKEPYEKMYWCNTELSIFGWRKGGKCKYVVFVDPSYLPIVSIRFFMLVDVIAKKFMIDKIET